MIEAIEKDLESQIKVRTLKVFVLFNTFTLNNCLINFYLKILFINRYLI